MLNPTKNPETTNSASNSQTNAASKSGKEEQTTGRPQPASSTQTKRQWTIDDLPQEIILTSGGKQEEVEPKFEAWEHSDIGNFVILKLLTSLPDDNEFKKLLLTFLQSAGQAEVYDPWKADKVSIDIYKLTLASGLLVTPGEIVALAGDFFGVADEPIGFGVGLTEQKDRFAKALKNLIDASQEPAFIAGITNHFRDEALTKSPHSQWSYSYIKQKFVDATPEGNNIYYGIKRAEGKTISDWWHSPYYELALKNFDHFGGDAKTAFLAGHALAVEKAKAAGTAPNPGEKAKLLKEAILLMFFALHYYTDHCAGGHIRVLRRQILNYMVATANGKEVLTKDELNAVPNLKEIPYHILVMAGYFARKMHDEDGDKGIYVKTNTSDEPWLARGDGNYYSKENVDSAKKTCEAALVAVQDLFLAYNQQETKLDEQHFEDYVPKADVATNAAKGRNPLFRVEGDDVSGYKVVCRADIGKKIQEKGLVKGALNSLPCSAHNAAFIACRFFNLKVVPAAKKVEDAAKQAENAVKDTANTVVTKLEEVSEKFAQELQEQLDQFQPPCAVI